MKNVEFACKNFKIEILWGNTSWVCLKRLELEFFSSNRPSNLFPNLATVRQRGIDHRELRIESDSIVVCSWRISNKLLKGWGSLVPSPNSPTLVKNQLPANGCLATKQWSGPRGHYGEGHYGALLQLPAKAPSSTGDSEPVFLNVYGAQESIPKNEYRQPV
jgi:hypothetical protein